MSLIAMEGKRGHDIPKVLADALERSSECDGIVIFMQRKSGGLLWFAPDDMKLETLVFYCYTALQMFANMALGIKM